MDKALSIGRISASGSTILLIGQVVSTIILAIGIIVLGMFIQEGEYGVYAIALIPSSTILLFHDWGVSTALTRFSAKCRNTNKEGELHKIIKAGLIFEFLMGLILMMVSLLIANWVASTVLGKPNAAFFITLVSVTILSAPILLGAQSLFLGFDKIKFTGFTSIYQAIMQATLSILLVFSGYGTLGVILGYILSVTSSTVLAIILLYFGIIRKLPRNSSSELSISSALRQLLAFGFPLGINTIMSSFMAQFYFFMVALSVSEGIIGNYRMALNFVSFIAFITIPISNVLLPAFSKLDPKTEPHILKSVFKSSVKYTNVLLLPASMAVIVLSKPLVSTLYADKWLYASFFLSLAATVYLFESFGPISIRSLLTAVGETKFLMKIRILAIAIGIPLAFLIIPEFGIPGVVLVDILDTFPGMMIGVYWAWKRYGVIVDFRTIGKIAFASLLATLTTFIFLNMFNAAAWIMLVVGAGIFLMTYLISAPLIGVVDQIDVTNLRVMFSGLGIISKMLEIPLIIMAKIIKWAFKKV